MPIGAADPRRIATRKDFGRELSLAKESADVSVREMARAIGAPASTVGGYLSGKHLPALRPPGQLAKVLLACGIEGEEIVDLWRLALSRARRAAGDQASPGSPVDPVPPSALPDTPGPEQPPAAKPALVSTKPPTDRLAQGPVLRGREEVVRRLTLRLSELGQADGQAHPSVFVLHGLGGSGKSTVALTIAKLAFDKQIDSWWITGTDAQTILAGMQALAAELGGDPEQMRMGSPPDVVWRLLEEHHRPWLLVIDNADDPLSALALPGAAVTDGNGWVRSVRSGFGFVVVTSRDGGAKSWGVSPPPGLELLAVRPLSSRDGALVLTELAGPDAGPAQEAEALAARLGGLPLALCLAGRHIAEAASTPPAFAGAETARDFAAYQVAMDRPGGDLVKPTWELSLDLLASRGMPLARPLLRLLSCLGPAPVACGLILRPGILAESPIFGQVSGRQVWEMLRALAGLGIVDLARDQDPDPDLADVVVPHQLVRDTSRRSADVLSAAGDYLAVTTALMTAAASGLDPKDPRTWNRWRALVDHSNSPLDLVMEFKVSPRAVPPGVLTAATLSARYLRSAGELARAEAAYARLARLGIAAVGGEDPRVLDIQHDLSRVWYDLGRLSQAIRGLRAVLKVRSKVLGPAHRDTLTTQHYLARALRDNGQLDAAWRLFRKTLDSRRAVLGDDHPDTLTSRNNAADALRALGNLDQAAGELQAVLEARIRVLGDEHPATLVSRYNLARLTRDRDEPRSAKGQLMSLVDTYERVLGADHPRTLLTRQALIDVWHDLGETKRALHAARDLLARRHSLLGARHPATLVTHHRIGLLLIDLGAHAEAETELAAVLAARQLVLGARHPDTELVLACLNALRSRK